MKNVNQSILQNTVPVLSSSVANNQIEPEDSIKSNAPLSVSNSMINQSDNEEAVYTEDEQDNTSQRAESVAAYTDDEQEEEIKGNQQAERSPTYQEWLEEQGYSPLKDLIIDNQDNELPESEKEEDPENKVEISDDEYSDDSYTGGAKPYSLHPNPFIDKIKKKRGKNIVESLGSIKKKGWKSWFTRR